MMKKAVRLFLNFKLLIEFRVRAGGQRLSGRERERAIQLEFGLERSKLGSDSNFKCQTCGDQCKALNLVVLLFQFDSTRTALAVVVLFQSSQRVLIIWTHRAVSICLPTHRLTDLLQEGERV